MFESTLTQRAWSLQRGVFTLDPADPRLSAASMIALLDALDVGPDHVRLLSQVDLPALDDISRLLALRTWHRVAAWASAQEQRAIVAVAGSEARGGGSECPDEWSAEEIAGALRLAPSTAGKRIAVARELTGRLADTWSALATGRISYWHAAHLAEALTDHTDPVAAAVQAAVLSKAAGQTSGQFRRSVAQAIASADPATFAERHIRASRLSDVQVWAEADGMAALLARGPAPQIYEMYDQINWQAAAARTAAQRADMPALADAAASAVKADMSVGERRFDAFTELMSRPAGAVSDPGGPPGARRHVGVLMDLPTALGLADHPGEIPGYGPIPGPIARGLAADADWHAWITDAASGQLTALGTHHYRPSRKLREFIEARDRTCMLPGCARAAWRCDIDHALPYDAGGCTDAANCGCFCRRHHRLKHESRWRLGRAPDGTVHWQSRLRQKFTVHPPDYRWMLHPPEPPAGGDSTEPLGPPEPPEGLGPPERAAGGDLRASRPSRSLASVRPTHPGRPPALIPPPLT